MLLYIILFFAVLQSITCDFPSFIIKCKLPDPNANDCILNSARYAFPYLLDGEPSINLPNFTTTYFNGENLILEYNYERNNTDILLYGQIQPSLDFHIYEASIDLNWPRWHLLFGSSLATSDLNFILNIYDESRTIHAKGHISIIQDNWICDYNSNYETVEIDNVNYMQIGWAYAYITDDTFEINFTEISTLDDQPITGPELIRVKKALRNFEGSYHAKLNEMGQLGITFTLNTILKLVPENEIFLPAPNPCSENEY